MCLYFSKKYDKSITNKSVVLIPPILLQTNFLSIYAFPQVYFIAHAEHQPLADVLLLTSFSWFKDGSVIPTQVSVTYFSSVYLF